MDEQVHMLDRARSRAVDKLVSRRVRFRAGAVVVLSLLIAAGCGSGSGGDETQATRDSVPSDTREHHEVAHNIELRAASEPLIVRAGEARTTPVGADLVHCIATAEQTGGSYSFLQVDVPAGGGPVLPHEHDSSEEWFYLMSGTASFQVGELRTDVGPGDFVHVPRGTTHTFTATTDTRLVAGYAPGGEEGRLFCPT